VLDINKTTAKKEWASSSTFIFFAFQTLFNKIMRKCATLCVFVTERDSNVSCVLLLLLTFYQERHIRIFKIMISHLLSLRK
jgi:hypothetical protein